MIEKIYRKPFKTLDEQVDILRSRGLVIEDNENAKASLGRIGYDRLRTYLFHMEEPPVNGERSRKFKPNSRFSDAIRCYEFDLRLKLFVLEAISHIEIAIGTKWAYSMSERYGSHAYLDEENFLDENLSKRIGISGGLHRKEQGESTGGRALLFHLFRAAASSHWDDPVVNKIWGTSMVVPEHERRSRQAEN